MKTATTVIAVPIQISVQRSLLAAEVAVAVGETAPSTAVGTTLVDTFVASAFAMTWVTAARAAGLDLDVWKRSATRPLATRRDSMVIVLTEVVPFRCGQVSD